MLVTELQVVSGCCFAKL